jgi:hypothetical protein
MKKTLIIIIAIFFTTSVYASHGNWTCTKKSIKRGAHVGENHGDEYMPQFINFFKENLL